MKLMHDSKGIRPTRRDILRTSALVTAGACFSWGRPSWAAGNGLTLLRRGVGTFDGTMGGTIGWLVSNDALVVVDTQFPDPAKLCWEALRKKSRRRIDVLLNTHHHGDHTAGNGVFQPHAERVVAHQNVPELQRKAAEEKGSLEGQVYADTTFAKSWRADLGSETVRADYLGPAHTSGDAVIHFEKANVVHMGDLVFNRFPCFIDRPAGATITGWMTLLEKVHADYGDDALFIFGHGGSEHGTSGGRADLLVMRDFLGGLLEHAASAIKDGKSEDQVAETERLPTFPDHYLESWKVAIPNALRVAYQELSEDGD